MKINTMRDDKIELYLSDEEIEKIFGGYDLIDYDAPECRIKIHSLLLSAAPCTLLPLNCDRVLIEVKPKEYGCTITLTKIYGSPKKYRQSAKMKTIVFVFEDSNSMIASTNCMKALKAEKSELYSNGKEYALIIISNRENKKTIAGLCEYCTIKLRRTEAERIREYWQPVCTSKALEKLCEFF
ncbi:MAG: adaptor protein MecA [Clostridia bacterium]|nr:adaptor protein MecA [Clostridia bacterium]